MQCHVIFTRDRQCIAHKYCLVRFFFKISSQKKKSSIINNFPNTLSLLNWKSSGFANTCVPITSRNCNSLPTSVFPSTYNLQTFKTRVHKHLHLHPLSHLINFPFSSVMQGSFEIHRGCIILVRPFLHWISLKKKMKFQREIMKIHHQTTALFRAIGVQLNIKSEPGE